MRSAKTAARRRRDGGGGGGGTTPTNALARTLFTQGLNILSGIPLTLIYIYRDMYTSGSVKAA